MDLKEGFHQVPVKNTDVHKTAMSTPWGSYEYVRMPFGLRNAPQTFQRFMNIVLHGTQDMFVYLDDIIVFSDNMVSHQKQLIDLFKRLNDYGLVINVTKSEFYRQSVIYLGLEFTTLGYRPAEAVIPKLQEYPPLTSRKDIMKFLGLINYYKSHIPNMTKIAAPLSRMLSNK